MFASQQKLDNLILIVDNNNQISLDKLVFLSVEPLDQDLRALVGLLAELMDTTTMGYLVY